MAARVRVRLRRSGGQELVTVAILNGGFEADEPHVLVPRRAADGLFSDLSGAAERSIATAGGTSHVLAVEETVEATILTRGREGPTATLRVIVSEAETEVLASDTAIDALGVKIESHGKGLWRFEDERETRSSEASQVW